MSLSPAEIERLETILFSDDSSEDALDYFGLHGLICSTVVGPINIKKDRLLNIIFGNDGYTISSEEKDFLNKIISIIEQDIRSQLQDEDDIQLPYSEELDNDENGHYDACLESWCCGFLEGFFENEKAWFTKGEDIAAELLLPIMALSGLFDADEFTDIRKNHKLMSQFEEIIPDQLVDIFLFYHAE